MKTAVEGILYPVDACSKIGNLESSSNQEPRPFVYVPHAAWTNCKDQLDTIFSQLANLKPTRIFVLAPLHKGPINKEDIQVVYTPLDGILRGSDWQIKLDLPANIKELVQTSDDICSEEHSLEIIAHYLYKLFSSSPVTYLLAAGQGTIFSKIVKILQKDFPDSLFLISNNSSTSCAHLWLEAFK